MDQGAVPGNIPILFPCHFQQTQVTWEDKQKKWYWNDDNILIITCPFHQYCFYNADGEIFIGGIKSHKFNSNRCLVDPGSGSTPTLQECLLAKVNQLNMHWDFRQVRPQLTPVQWLFEQSRTVFWILFHATISYIPSCDQTFAGPSNHKQSNKEMSWGRPGRKLLLWVNHSAVQWTALEDWASCHTCLVLCLNWIHNVLTKINDRLDLIYIFLLIYIKWKLNLPSFDCLSLFLCHFCNMTYKRS